MRGIFTNFEKLSKQIQKIQSKYVHLIHFEL
jgi:hypothetical protein